MGRTKTAQGPCDTQSLAAAGNCGPGENTVVLEPRCTGARRERQPLPERELKGLGEGMPGPSLPPPPPSLVKGSPGRSASQGTEKGKEGCGQWVWWGWGRHTLGKWEITSEDAIKPPCSSSWAAFQDGEIQSISESHTSSQVGAGIKTTCTAFSACASPPFKRGADTPSH